MRSTNWLAITLAAALCGGFLLTVPPAQAAKGASRQTVRSRIRERAKTELNLTDQQVAQIKQILKADKGEIAGLVTRLHDARVGLRGAIQAPGATEASVRVASAKVAAVEADLAVERLRLFGKISPILTAEQREKLQELRGRADDFVDKLINRAGARRGE